MAAKKLPYIAFFTSDYIKDTRILSLQARAVWMDMLCLMNDGDRRGYLSRGDSPLSLDQLARFSGCPAEVISRCVHEILDSRVASRGDDGVIFSRRMVRDEKRRTQSAAHGKRGGNPTLKGTLNPTLKGTLNPRLEDGNGCGNGDGFSSGGVGGCGGRGPPADPPGFADFWAAYPRHADRTGAAAAWRELSPPPALRSEILAGVARQKLSDQWQRGVHPNAATWLRRRGWEDELPAANGRHLACFRAALEGD